MDRFLSSFNPRFGSYARFRGDYTLEATAEEILASNGNRAMERWGLDMTWAFTLSDPGYVAELQERGVLSWQSSFRLTDALANLSWTESADLDSARFSMPTNTIDAALQKRAAPSGGFNRYLTPLNVDLLYLMP